MRPQRKAFHPSLRQAWHSRPAASSKALYSQKRAGVHLRKAWLLFCGSRFSISAPHENFLAFKRQLSRLLDHAADQNSKIPMTDLFHMMGMPTNWKRVTAYHKIWLTFGQQQNKKVRRGKSPDVLFWLMKVFPSTHFLKSVSVKPPRLGLTLAFIRG